MEFLKYIGTLEWILIIFTLGTMGILIGLMANSIRFAIIVNNLYTYYNTDDDNIVPTAEFDYKGNSITLMAKRQECENIPVSTKNDTIRIYFDTVYINEIAAITIVSTKNQYGFPSRRIYFNHEYDNKDIFKILRVYNKFYRRAEKASKIPITLGKYEPKKKYF